MIDSNPLQQNPNLVLKSEWVRSPQALENDHKKGSKVMAAQGYACNKLTSRFDGAVGCRRARNFRSCSVNDMTKQQDHWDSDVELPGRSTGAITDWPDVWW